jgi:hypothetical protein
VVFEWFGDYAYLQSRQWSFDGAVDFMLNNHVTLINDNIGGVPSEVMPQLEKLARLAGARFVLRELAHEKTVKRGAPLNLQMKWANVGVGKLHHPYALRLYLLGGAAKPVLSADAKADPRDWLPGEHSVTESIPIPTALDPGDYAVALALIEPKVQHRPWRLAIAAPENEGRYEISNVKVE